MKTAMQELIEKLETKRAMFTKETAASKETRRTYSVAILTAKNMLIEEKQQIIDAFNAGVDACSEPAIPHDPEHYYSTTFKN